MILLDTVVISELRKRQPSPALVDWLAGVRDNDLFLSVVSIGEIERGNVRHFATSGVEVINPFGD